MRSSSICCGGELTSALIADASCSRSTGGIREMFGFAVAVGGEMFIYLLILDPTSLVALV